MTAWTWKQSSLQSIAPQSKGHTYLFSSTERHNLRKWLTEAGAEVGWQRDYHKEESGGWEPGGGEFFFVV